MKTEDSDSETRNGRSETTNEKLQTRNQKPETRNSRGRREQFMLYAPLLIWIGVILLLGSNQGSMTRTSLIIRPILEFLFPTAPEETLQFYHGIIRKLAHLTEYAVLALLACRAFVRLERLSLRRRFYLLAILLVMAVAAVDEFIQSFNPQRTGTPIDIVIDTVGGLVAIGFYYLSFAKRLPDKPAD